MWTAILAALNLAEGADHDVWSVNAEEVYLEEGESSTSSSISNSSAEPTVTVVIGSNAPPDAARGVPGGARAPGRRRRRGPRPRDRRRARRRCASAFPGRRSRTLRARSSRALARRHRRGRPATSSRSRSRQMVPAPRLDRSASASQHAEHEAVGGAIDPAPGLRLVDWAEYFCRYARDMRPFEAHATRRPPGRQRRLQATSRSSTMRDGHRDGFWEPVVAPPALEATASTLWHTPSRSSARAARRASARSSGSASSTAGSTGTSAARDFSTARNLARRARGPARAVPDDAARAARRASASGASAPAPSLALPIVFVASTSSGRSPRRAATSTMHPRPMSAPELSVVVASVNGLPYLGACLEALERHAPGAEVIVADCDRRADAAARRGGAGPTVKLLSFDEPMTRPGAARRRHLRRARAVRRRDRGPLQRDARGGRSGSLAAHRAGHSVVGGPVRNVMTDRGRATGRRSSASTAPSWSPAPGGPVGDLPG